MSIQPRATLPATAFTLPARYYTDPALFDREGATLFRRWWIGVGRLEDVPQPGSFVTREIAGASLVIVRGADDRMRAFHNVCRHRGTKLCDADEGSVGARIVCPYHAWTYDLTGRLLAAPHMDGSPGFRREDFPLREVRADVWEGFIFVSLAADGPRLADHLGRVPETFRPWRMAGLRRVARLVYDVGANWKLVVQNYNECLHCPTLHPALNRLSHYLGGDNEPLNPTYMGGRMDLNPGVGTMSMDGASRRAPLPDLPADDCRRVYYYSIFPNFLVAPHPDYVLTHTLWPRSCASTRIVCEWLAHPAEIAKPGFDLTDATSFWDLTNRQDWRVCELAQQGIGSLGYTPGPYSNREDLLYAFDRLIVEMLDEASSAAADQGETPS